jgi:hypothetical protein
MKKTALFLAIICLLTLNNFAQTKTETFVKELETKRFVALTEKNIDYLQNIFSDNLVYVHSSGTFDNKETYIGSLTSGKTVYNEVNIIELDTHQYAKNLVVNRGKAKLKVNNGTPFSIYFTSIYEKVKAGWKMVSWEATRLPI